MLSLMLISFGGWSQPAKQQPRPPTKPKAPTITCSDTATLKTCTSFKQLVEAHDKDILETISSGTSYVCFRPTDDAFLLLHFEMPRRDGWKKDDSGEKQWGTSAVALTEYRDGVFYAVKKGRSTWYRIAASEEPFLSFYPTEGLLTKDVGITIDGSEATISYSFKNQNGGTTQYSFNGTIHRNFFG
jgi:hypothetical protein